MDIAFDTVWCPVCSRQILPKRFLVPIPPPLPHAAPAPPPPPSSPTSQPKTTTTTTTTTQAHRTKAGPARARAGGLVHGTGRVKPNGALKRSDPTKEAPPKKAAAPQPKPGPVRHRTVIDQSPTPLYCSDECRLADLQSSHSYMSIDYKPERHSSPPLPPVPQNSLSDLSSTTEESASDADADVASNSGLSSASRSASIIDRMMPAHLRGYAALQAAYGLPDLPPPPPLLRSDTASSDDSAPGYTSGMIMASRRITDTFVNKPAPKRPSWCSPPAHTTTAAKPITGWTDGSGAWRASVYGFAPPKDLSTLTPDDNEAIRRSYGSCVASSHRAHAGVTSTMSDVAPPASSYSNTTNNNSGTRPRSEAEEMYAKSPLTFARRTESRASLARMGSSPSGSTRSLPVTAPTRTREVPLLKPGAEGRLLVPDVKMRRTLSAVYTDDRPYTYPAASRKRSPLNRASTQPGSDATGSTASSGSGAAKPAVEMRPWSYGDQKEYPLMMIPKKEKHIERRVVDGEEREVEVEVEVFPPLKRLFLFPDKEVRR